MKKDIDCQVFEDQLDALVEGSLPEEGIDQLRLHVLSCADCAMLVRVQEHLALPTLEELETTVPEDLLGSVWPRVEDVVKEGKEGGLGGVSAETRGHWVGPGKRENVRARETPEQSGGKTPWHRRSTWLIPFLAAASMALLFSTGFLVTQLRKSGMSEIRLARQVEELEAGLNELQGRIDGIERTGILASQSPWARAFSLDLSPLTSQESIRVEWIQQTLQKLPPDTPLLTASQVGGILRSPLSRGFPGLREQLAEHSAADGLSAQELLLVIEGIQLDPDQLIPTSRLRDFFQT